jgi:hypothetical protein
MVWIMIDQTTDINVVSKTIVYIRYIITGRICIFDMHIWKTCNPSEAFKQQN